jgi:hypothetical protein
LFISTVAAGNQSHYGRSKFLAEKHVLDLGGSVIRPGLVPDLNRYLTLRARSFALVPAFSGDIHLTYIEKLEESINEWIKAIRTDPKHQLSVNSVSNSVNFKEHLRSCTKHSVTIPLIFVDLSLRFLGLFSLKYRNLQDSFASLQSTSEIFMTKNT